MRRLTTRRFSAFLTAAVLALTITSQASAAPAARGFLPPNARVHGMTLAELAGAWNVWGFGSPADVNPLLANRCEASPGDPSIWFMPVSLGGDYAVDCAVPAGAFLVLTPGGYECSEAEGNGSTEAELRACADANVANLSLVETSLDGRDATGLDRYLVTSPLVELPAPNLLSDDATPSLIKGYFLVVHPLSRGDHTLRAYDEFANVGFAAGITMHITVS